MTPLWVGTVQVYGIKINGIPSDEGISSWGDYVGDPDWEIIARVHQNQTVENPQPLSGSVLSALTRPGNGST